MKYVPASKRSKAILGIAIFAICIGAISKKVINYPLENACGFSRNDF